MFYLYFYCHEIVNAVIPLCYLCDIGTSWVTRGRQFLVRAMIIDLLALASYIVLNEFEKNGTII